MSSATSPQGAPGRHVERHAALKGTNFNSTDHRVVLDGGITQNGSPVVVDPSNMTIKVNVAGNATPGLGNVTVTNVTPAAGSGTCTGCFTVDPAPTITRWFRRP